MNTLAVAEIEHLRLLFDILSVPTECGGAFSVQEARDACAELPSRLGLLHVLGALHWQPGLLGFQASFRIHCCSPYICFNLNSKIDYF